MSKFLLLSEKNIIICLDNIRSIHRKNSKQMSITYNNDSNFTVTYETPNTANKDFEIIMSRLIGQENNNEPS